MILHDKKDFVWWYSKLYNKSEICQMFVVKYLGIHIYEELNFKYHISFIETKVSRGVGILYNLKQFLPSSILLCVYYSLVHSHLMYGLIVWGSTL